MILDSQGKDLCSLPLLIDQTIFRFCIGLCSTESYPLKQADQPITTLPSNPKHSELLSTDLLDPT